MSWNKEYFVSQMQTHKTVPIKVKAKDKDEAYNLFKKALLEGKVEEEEVNLQIFIQEKWKQY